MGLLNVLAISSNLIRKIIEIKNASSLVVFVAEIRVTTVWRGTMEKVIQETSSTHLYPSGELHVSH